MITVSGTTIVIPHITNATATLNERNRVILKMNDGYVFWDRNDYRDANGEVYEPTLKEKSYSKWGSFSQTTDFTTFEELAENEIPEIPDEPEIPETPEEPETETQATEEDYINALKELGVTFDE